MREYMNSASGSMIKVWSRQNGMSRRTPIQTDLQRVSGRSHNNLGMKKKNNYSAIVEDNLKIIMIRVRVKPSPVTVTVT